jgi:hypothetical protein
VQLALDHQCLCCAASAVAAEVLADDADAAQELPNFGRAF